MGIQQEKAILLEIVYIYSDIISSIFISEDKK
jgi:hypothetical protein